MTTNGIELLAPAGNPTCLHAAVRAGADAVYLGTEDFNARRGADNFTLDTLAQACDYAHLRGVSVYLTVNIAVLPEEEKRAMELIRQAYRRGVDAFIVQDIGIASEMKRTLPEARLHISTQMNVHNAAGIEAAALLGAKRITFARELDLEEVTRLSQIAADMGIQTEVFAHGALCVCYSGQCLMSSLIGGRSANRGMCAQACRLPYSLHNKALHKDLPSPGEHLLSPKDLCTIDILPQLAETGVSSLKIEGRMKSPEYVSSVVGVYRDVLDRMSAPTEKQKQVLAEAFSRGFTTAYLTGDDGFDMMSYARPNNRGVFVGRVADVSRGFVTIDCEQKLEEGDVIEFWTGRGHFAVPVKDIKAARDGIRLAVTKKVGKGDRVFRVRSAAAAYTDIENEPKVPVAAELEIIKGQPLRLTLRTSSGIDATVEGPVVEAARTKAVTVEEAREHVDRFGSTPFCLGDFKATIDKDAGIGFSQLHKIRSQAAEQLQEHMLAPYHARVLQRTERATSLPAAHRGASIVAAWASNAACARAAKRAGADVIYVPAINYGRGMATVAGQLSDTVEQTGYPKQARIVLPVIDHDPCCASREQKYDFDAWKYAKSGKVVMAENTGELIRGANMGCEMEVGSHIPVLNRLSLDAMAQAGASRVWLSPELSLTQIEELGQASPVPLGLTIIGHEELMVTEHCLLMSQGPCKRDCSTCARRKSPHYLLDRKDYEMPVITDCCGRSHIYNAVLLDIAHLVPQLLEAGVDAFMVNTTLMNVGETTEAVSRAVRARDIAQRDGNAVSKAEGTTTGHVFRGVS